MVRTQTAATVVLWGGLDPGGQAGLAADLQVVHALGASSRLVVTALTAQTDVAWLAGVPVSNVLRKRVVDHLVLPDTALAFKSGMLASKHHARALAAMAQAHPGAPLVVDPLMASSSGGSMWPREDLQTLPPWLLRHLLPHAHVVTPNWPELAWLTGRTLHDLEHAEQALRSLPCPAVLKGGHAPESLRGIDWVWDGSTLTHLPAEHVWSRSPRGTGCRFATALAIHLAEGARLPHAAHAAKTLVAEMAYGL